jgi:AraC-like DNA-binding protein
MAATDEKDFIMERLYFLLEEKRVFLDGEKCDREIVRATGLSLRELDKIVVDRTGVNLNIIINLYRIQQARDLLAAGVEYETVWSLSGFESVKAMDRAFEDIVG